MNSNQSTGENRPTCARRDVLRGAAAGGFLLGSAALARPVAAQSVDADAFDAWFDGVSNYDGVVDATGQESVTVTVGAAGNNGNFAFGPAAVRVDPGTTVVWEWSGEGGMHNVVAEDGSFESDLQQAAGATFEHAFDAEGVTLYACAPHKQMGMRAAVVVGNVLVGGGTADYPEPNYGDWFDGTDNFDGTVDATGVDEVRVAVGGDGNGGSIAFEPAAVRVDPGTTVVWEWTGEGGEHAVVAEDGSFESDPSAEAGHAFALTVEGDGVWKYACPTHGDDGMRGAVVVGAGGSSETRATPLGLAVGGGLGGLIGLPFLYALYLHFHDLGEQERAAAARQERPGV